ncbi:MAG: acyltransferase [Sphingomonas sp.]
MSSGHELRALTSVRGLAAWMVVLFHIRLSMPAVPEPVLAVLAKGYLAVDFFFLLSGFVIWLSYAGRIREGGPGAVPEFLRRRLARIWPLHLFVLGSAVLLALMLAATGREAAHFPFAELPLHVLLLQNWGFTSGLTWNDPAWSISCELGAYLLFPLLALAIDWRRVPAPAILAAIAALLVLLHAVFAAHGVVGDRAARADPLHPRIRRRHRGLRAVAALARGVAGARADRRDARRDPAGGVDRGRASRDAGRPRRLRRRAARARARRRPPRQPARRRSAPLARRDQLRHLPRPLPPLVRVQARLRAGRPRRALAADRALSGAGAGELGAALP